MAQRTSIQLIDDLDDQPIEDGAGETVAFTYRGTSYEIDLSDDHVAEFDGALERFVSAARRTGGSSAARRSSSGSSAPRPRAAADTDPKAVRAWALAHGVPVNPRGRLKAEVVEQYKAAGN
jgi:hypothetical protein